MAPSQGWTDFLAPGEKLLWQGRPAPGVRLGDFLTARLPFGLVFTAFAVFWIMATSAMTQNTSMGFEFFPLFGIPFVLVGLHQVIGAPLWDAYERTHSWYALSDQAAFIATELFGRRALKRIPLADMNALELEDGVEGTVWFKRETQVHTSTTRTKNGLPRHRTYTSQTRTGFKRIADARQVYGLIARQLSRQSQTAS